MEIRVMPSGQRWAVRRAGRTNDLATTDSQEEAISIGRQYAKRSRCEFTVIGRDGMIRERDSFSGSPIFR
jgi:hypothetical protein